ncbi:MAG: hypothetical protein AAF539_04695 [Planctomycetota bacterium]
MPDSRMPDVNLADQTDDRDPGLEQVQATFVGKWNTLISTTNWEKGRIIDQWRTALIEADAPAREYSDEAWSQRVGGVTPAHVGRLRRVFVRFGQQYKTYEGLYWSHFLAAIEWDDASLWLQGAVEESWSVSAMRHRRWVATGSREADRPSDAQIINVDLDEDAMDLGTQPAQGDDRQRGDFDGSDSGISAGPSYEGPDFGDEDELSAIGVAGGTTGDKLHNADDASGGTSLVQPFAGLPELPDDLSDAVESLKLAILRHKTDGYRDVSVQTVQQYLSAMSTLATC